LIKDKVIQLELFSKDLVEMKIPEHDMFLCNNPVLERRKNQTRGIESRFEQKVRSVKKSWDKRRNQNSTILKNKTKDIKQKSM